MTKVLENYLPDPDDPSKIVYNDQRIPRVVVCAANRYGDLIICGARHYDGLMCGQIDAMSDDNRVKLKKARGNRPSDYEQGFIDQYGIFMSRAEAGMIALKNNQKMRNPDFDPEFLFSEDLY